MKNIYISSCAKDGGIYRYSFENGKLAFQDKTPLDRPMYAIIRENYFYAILRETDPETHTGGFVRFDIDPYGQLTNPSEIISTKGVCPCHLEADGSNVYVVNYLSGNIVKLPHQVVSQQGMGVHPIRQTSPHTHYVSFSPDKRDIVCADLGLDTIFVYDRDLNPKGSAKVPSASGARHLCFSHDCKYLYCVNELSNDVSVFEYNHGAPVLKNTYKALPEFHGDSAAAAIRIKDGFLYISNRGADTISRFAMENDGLRLLENTPCGGKGPRDFAIIDDWILCANEASNCVSVLKLQNGKPQLTGFKLELAAPLCITGE